MDDNGVMRLGRGRPEFPTKKRFKQFDSAGTEDINEWRKRFVDCMDVTEYAGGIELMGSWEDWCKFKRNWPYFTRNILPAWMEEIEVKVRSQALRTLLLDKGASASSSAKYLASGSYKPKQTGRPTNAMIEREARIQAGMEREFNEDYSRLLGE